MGTKIYTREDIEQALIEVAGEGKLPGMSALKQRGISEHWIPKLFPEGLTAVKKRLKLKISPQEQPRTDDELLGKIDEVVSKLKKIPSWNKLRYGTGIDSGTYNRRFGKRGIKEVFVHYRDWLKKYHPKSGNIKLVDAYLAGQEKALSPKRETDTRTHGGKITKYPKMSGRVYGAPLYFGNLIYEPTNEQGVVFLFGMVSKWLGFSVEGIGIEYPDCEAKRNIGKGRQQHVRIEFEYRSRDFDHDPIGCDLIVCWEDNWGKSCPLPVIELKKEIKALRESSEFRPE